jgi:hypothetical protein
VEFSSLDVKFEGLDSNVTVYHAKDTPDNVEGVQMVKIGTIGSESTEESDKTGWLRWQKNGVTVLCGNIVASKAGEIKVCRRADSI